MLFRRRECVFIAFDLLYLNGKDLRMLPLIKRKARLRRRGGSAHESFDVMESVPGFHMETAEPIQPSHAREIARHAPP
jgi:ATP-dependent DNA ligase